MNKFLFWQQWLFWSCVLFVGVGLAMVLLSSSSILTYYYEPLSTVLFGTKVLPAEAEIFRKFIVGPFGGTMIACYSLAAFISHYAFKNKEPWARNAIAISFALWAIIDSIVCIRMELYFQVYLLNAFSVLIKLLPLIFTWRDFK